MNHLWTSLILCLVLSSTLSTPTLWADDDAPTIAVGAAKIKKSVLAIAPFVSSKELESQAKTAHTIIDTDLKWVDLFKILEPAAFIEIPGKDSGVTPDKFKMSAWTSIGTEHLVKAELSQEAGSIIVEGYLYDTVQGKQLIGKRYKGAASDLKTIAHTFAGEIVKTLTGNEPIFLTKIVMSCAKSKGRAELYVTDFDGSNARQITSHKSIAFAPAWNKDGTKIAYSLFAKHADNVKNIDLYELDFKTNAARMLSNRKGINSGAAFSPDGNKIALTMSFLGNPEIFIFNPGDSTVTRLTKSFGVDVDPAFSPDGKKLAFVSSRSGMPMVYTMNIDGEQVKRLTFAGRYNATPSWSPDGKKILFAGWNDNRFDVFLIDPEGKQIERLTRDQGNNEDPFFSPDGNFIVFSSNRSGQKNIYVMNRDGTFQRRLTYGLGDCVSPKWSK